MSTTTIDPATMLTEVITVKTLPGWTGAGETRIKDGYMIIHLKDPDHKDHFVTVWTKTMDSSTVTQAIAMGQKIVCAIKDLPDSDYLPVDIAEFKTDAEVMNEVLQTLISDQQQPK